MKKNFYYLVVCIIFSTIYACEKTDNMDLVYGVINGEWEVNVNSYNSINTEKLSKNQYLWTFDKNGDCYQTYFCNKSYLKLDKWRAMSPNSFLIGESGELYTILLKEGDSIIIQQTIMGSQSYFIEYILSRPKSYTEGDYREPICGKYIGELRRLIPSRNFEDEMKYDIEINVGKMNCLPNRITTSEIKSFINVPLQSFYLNYDYSCDSVVYEEMKAVAGTNVSDIASLKPIFKSDTLIIDIHYRSFYGEVYEEYVGVKIK